MSLTHKIGTAVVLSGLITSGIITGKSIDDISKIDSVRLYQTEPVIQVYERKLEDLAQLFCVGIGLCYLGLYLYRKE